MSKGFRADNKILIMWPESQRIMGHPDADLDSDLTQACWISPEVWEEYRDSYYEPDEEEEE
tara:strand:- start:1457 stop:1639 length:183 start_codon:yes stop_codon:yes gene_type:complete